MSLRALAYIRATDRGKPWLALKRLVVLKPDIEHVGAAAESGNRPIEIIVVLLDEFIYRHARSRLSEN